MDGQEMLGAMAGEWTGTYRLWLDPGQLRTECETQLRAEAVVGGRAIQATYDWTDTGGDGAAQTGTFLLACPEGARWEMAWGDTWHMGHALLWSIGPDGKVTGTYGPADEPWGWRTEFEMPAADRLVIRAYNITPSGEEALATEADYRRA
jgi:hypothetical protein